MKNQKEELRNEMVSLSSHFEATELENRLEYGWGSDCHEVSCEVTENGCYKETVTVVECNN